MVSKFKVQGIRFSKWYTEWIQALDDLESGDWDVDGAWGLPKYDDLIDRSNILEERVTKVFNEIDVGDIFGLTNMSTRQPMIIIRLPDSEDGEERYMYQSEILDLHDLAQVCY